jgi:hypothetical protein
MLQSRHHGQSGLSAAVCVSAAGSQRVKATARVRVVERHSAIVVAQKPPHSSVQTEGPALFAGQRKCPRTRIGEPLEVRCHRTLPAHHHERPRHIVEAVSAFVTRCDTVGVLEDTPLVSKPEHMLERRLGHHYATKVRGAATRLWASSPYRAATDDHINCGATRTDWPAIDAANAGSANTRRSA